MNARNDTPISTTEQNLVWILVGVTVLDRAITAPLFQYEANPIVEMIGWYPWILLTTVLLGAAVNIWYRQGLWTSKIAKGAVMGATALTAIAIGLNLGQVWFVFG